MRESAISKTPRQLRTAEVKRSIVQAAIDIIREHGMEYVTIDNICKAAGVSVGSFYHHFGSKDALLAQYLGEAFERRAAEFEQITGDDVIANILRYYSLYNTFLLNLGFEFVRNFYTNTNKGLYSHRNYLLGTWNAVPLTKAVDDILCRARNAGYLEEDCDIGLLIYDMSVLEKGVLFDWCLCDGEYDLDAQMTRLLRNYLARSVVSEKYRNVYGESGV